MFRILLTTFLLVTICPFSWADNSAVLQETSKAFSQIGKKAMPAAVFIKVQYQLPDAAGKSPEDYENPFDYFGDEFFRKFFGHPGVPGGRQQPAPQGAGGSGFIVSSDGYILTNDHVVKDAKQITVVMNNGDEYEAKLIGEDPRTDLAVIKIETEKKFEYLSFGDSEKLEIGDWAIAVGSPFALQSSLTVGVISAKGRNNLRITDLEDFLQTDAAINPGNSGGPLLNINGEVIGVNTAIVSRSGGGYMGIGFAIPSNMAKHIMTQIIDNGVVKRGYLGVYLQQLDKTTAEAFELDKTEGVLVSEVTKDSPAEKGGLKQGDIILECNGQLVKNASSFRNEVALMEPATTVDLKVLRDGKQINVKVVLGDSPDAQISKQSTQIGMEVSDLKELAPNILQQWGYTQSTEGVIVVSIKRGSIADKAGIRPGMLVLQLNNLPVKNKKDFQEAMKSTENKKYLVLLVKFQNVTKYITIKIQ